MKKIIGVIFGGWVLLGFSPQLVALTIKSIVVTDSLGTVRSNFSSSEKINFNVSVYNDITVERINFTFEVYDPFGVKKLTHSGNSLPGSLGEGGSAIKNIPISSFFDNPGTYRLVVKANNISGETSFSVYSPNITLTYPPNNSRDLTDNPLSFRWVASGASRYKLSVDDDAAFYNCIFTAEVFSTDYIYPANPTDARQKLSSGVVYYWKVEGLDAAGRVIASCSQPFNFSIKQIASTTSSRDLAIIALEPQDKNILVEVKNLGGRTENNVPVSLYANGQIVANQTISLISPGEIKTLIFPLTIAGSVNVLAAITFEDDYSRNNILSRVVEVAPEIAVSSLTVVVSTVPVSEETEEEVSRNPKLIWNKLKKYLPDKGLISRVESEYEIKEVIWEKDIGVILKQLKEGRAKIVEAGLE